MANSETSYKNNVFDLADARKSSNIKPTNSANTALGEIATSQVSPKKLRNPLGAIEVGREEEKMSDADDKIDLKIALVEQRLETRLVGLDAKLDKLSVSLDAKMARIFDKMESVGEKAQDAKVAAQEAKAAATSVKWNILFAALGTLAVLLAIWGIWAQGIEMIAGLLAK